MQYNSDWSIVMYISISYYRSAITRTVARIYNAAFVIPYPDIKALGFHEKLRISSPVGRLLASPK